MFFFFVEEKKAALLSVFASKRRALYTLQNRFYRRRLRRSQRVGRKSVEDDPDGGDGRERPSSPFDKFVVKVFDATKIIIDFDDDVLDEAFPPEQKRLCCCCG